MFSNVFRNFTLRTSANIVNQRFRNYKAYQCGNKQINYVVPQSQRYIQVVQKSSDAQSQKIVPIVCYEDIKKMISKSDCGTVLIDVREPDELKETGKIPTSINIPLGCVGNELKLEESVFKRKYGIEKPKSNSTIIFHCRSGKRSLKAAEIASTLGFRNVKNYEGSWLDWADREGLPK